MGRKKEKGGSEIPLPPEELAAVGGVAGIDGKEPFDKSRDPNLELKIESLHKAMESLTERQREVITLRYWENMTQEEVADVLSMRQQSVSDIEKQAIKRLGKSKSIVKLKTK